MTDADFGLAKHHLPAWSQILIGFALLGIIATIATAAWSFVFIRHLARDSINPPYIRKVAQEIADLPDPLPSGNNYEFGFSLGNFRFVVISQSPNKQQLALICIKNTELPDTKETLYKAYDIGIKTVEKNVASQEIKSKGEEPIANEKLLYLLGEITDRSGSKRNWMVGCTSDKKSRKSIIVFAWQPLGSVYNFNLTMGLLKSIRHF